MISLVLSFSVKSDSKWMTREWKGQMSFVKQMSEKKEWKIKSDQSD